MTLTIAPAGSVRVGYFPHPGQLGAEVDGGQQNLLGDVGIDFADAAVGDPDADDPPSRRGESCACRFHAPGSRRW